jgi:hypothetical protein
MMKRLLAVACLGLASVGAVAVAANAEATPRSSVPMPHSVPAPEFLNGKGKDGDSCKKQTDCAPGYACRKSVCRKA